MIREGRLIKVPRFITGAVFVAPIKKLIIGISKRAPPPPLIIDNENVNTPEPNMIKSNRTSMSFSRSSI